MIQEDKRLPEERVRLYAAEIVIALSELHARDIIHRRINPQNILIDDKGHIKLADFGASKNVVGGPFAYQPPEMLQGLKHGKEADWYMLGVLLYEMMTGLPAYYAAS